MRARTLVLLAAVGLLAAACAAGTGDSPSAGPTGTAGGDSELSAQVASFDLAAGTDQRLTVGLFTQTDQGPRPLVGGEVELQLAYLGEGQAASEAEPVGTATAAFLPVPGQGPQGRIDQPTPAEGGAVGVYEASVDLPDPGLYVVTATADVAGAGPVSTTTTFPVAAEHQVPTVGEQAPTPANATVDDPGGLPPVAIDSRARNNDGEVPDRQLHDATVAETVAAGRPAVVVVSTPVFCQSRFCGPITETVQQLAGRYGDRAEFIHLEVWRNFQNRQLNDAAGAFIRTEAGGSEPWTFLIGADGTIRARWDNVLDAAALEEMLREL